jgi:hypothetical protein
MRERKYAFIDETTDASERKGANIFLGFEKTIKSVTNTNAMSDFMPSVSSEFHRKRALLCQELQTFHGTAEEMITLTVFFKIQDASPYTGGRGEATEGFSVRYAKEILVHIIL